MSQFPPESLLQPSFSGGSLGGTRFRTFGEIPDDVLASAIALLCLTFPMPSKPQDVAGANFELGRYSVIQRFIDERDIRARRAEQAALQRSMGVVNA